MEQKKIEHSRCTEARDSINTVKQLLHRLDSGPESLSACIRNN
jgi:hypothetical protein